MSYLTIELKTNSEGGTAAEVVYTGADRRYAERKYHETLATAATSGRPCHAAILIQGDGTLLDTYCYVTEQEPATE